MEQVEIGGLNIAFERKGSGPPVVLLHGGLSDGREWRRQLDELSDEFTLVAWDAPGCGGSADPPASFRMPDYADCLVAFIGALGLGRPHVLGLSWGGTLALELYRRWPNIPRTLLLASSYAGWAGSLPAHVITERLDEMLRALLRPPEQLVRGFIPSLLTHRAPAEMVEELVMVMSDFRPSGCRPMLHAMAEADLRDVLPRIEVPTLLLSGDADVRSPPEVAEQLHAQIPDSTLRVLPGVGHQSNIEAARAFNAAVREFLRGR
ncbi:MAG: alpha/beta hydrolase [Myxococcales bacterium]|nr:alpha/beta hydrolase [Myxococcales bacterium]